MNKKQNLLAIALSASFVLAGANVAEASEQVQNPSEQASPVTNEIQGGSGQTDKKTNETASLPEDKTNTEKLVDNTQSNTTSVLTSQDSE